ncbi:hypothetical protein EVH07_11940 [Salmonella enterica subsp. enterica serovar Newport]|nr:hypothetical protein [Salmonella enterica subsp. enterica serovar Newport]
MKIQIPRDAVAVAIDYTGNAKHITAVRLIPEKNCVIPQFQLNANPSSKDFGQWLQAAPFRTQTNAQMFISGKTHTAARLWFVTADRRFVDMWERPMGFVKAEDIQLAPEPEVVAPAEEAKDEDQVG